MVPYLCELLAASLRNRPKCETIKLYRLRALHCTSTLLLTGECRDGSTLVSATHAAGYDGYEDSKYAHIADHVRRFQSRLLG